MPPVKPAELNLMSVDELKAFLTSEHVQFSDGALKPELLQTARDHVTQAAAKTDSAQADRSAMMPEPQAPPDAPAAIPETTKQDEILRIFHSKGFRDATECRNHLNAIERDLALLESKKKEVAELYKDLEMKNIQLAQARKDLEAQDVVRREDMRTQAELYDRNAQIKKTLMDAGLAGAQM